jgi:succinoglycan biosynthesis transport protein ExoP
MADIVSMYVTGAGDDHSVRAEIRRWLGAVRHRWWVVLIPALLVSLAVTGVQLHQHKVYEASVELVLPETSPYGSIQSTDALSTALATELQLAESGQAVAAAAAIVGPSFSHVKSINAQQIGTGLIIAISVKSEVPAVAQSAANALGKAYIQQRAARAAQASDQIVNQLQTQAVAASNQITTLDAQISAGTSFGSSPSVTSLETQRDAVIARLTAINQDLAQAANTAPTDQPAQILGNAGLPTSPVSPKPLREGLVGLAGGLALGFVLAVGAEAVDDRIRTVDEARRMVGRTIPILGVESARFSPSGVTEPSDSLEWSSAARRITGLLHAHPAAVIVAGTSSDEPAASATVCLANALLAFQKDVGIVDADFERHGIDRLMKIESSPGLVDLLSGTATIDAVVFQYTDEVHPSLAVIPAGFASGEPPWSSVPNVLPEIATRLGLALVAAPPVIDGPQAASFGQVSAGVVVVAELRSTHGGELRTALGRLADSGSTVLALLLIGHE